MSAEVVPLSAVEDPQPVLQSGSVYLDAYLAPFAPCLARDTVT